MRGAVGVERRAGGRQRDARRSAAMRRMRQGARGGTVVQLSAVRVCRILSEREWHHEGHLSRRLARGNRVGNVSSGERLDERSIEQKRAMCTIG